MTLVIVLAVGALLISGVNLFFFTKLMERMHEMIDAYSDVIDSLAASSIADRPQPAEDDLRTRAVELTQKRFAPRVLPPGVRDAGPPPPETVHVVRRPVKKESQQQRSRRS